MFATQIDRISQRATKRQRLEKPPPSKPILRRHVVCFCAGEKAAATNCPGRCTRCNDLWCKDFVCQQSPENWIQPWKKSLTSKEAMTILEGIPKAVQDILKN